MKFKIAPTLPRALIVATLIGTSCLLVRFARAENDEPLEPAAEGGTGSIRVREPSSDQASPGDSDKTPAAVRSPEREESPARITQPRREDAAPRYVNHRVKIEGASLKGIQPGRSTSEELGVAWGPAKEIRKPRGLSGAAQHFYKVEMFDRVMVSVTNDVVSSIVVYFDKPLPAAEVAKQLDLSEIEPATVYDPKGQLLGQAFPERGVLFGFIEEPTAKMEVSQIVLEPIDAQPFMLRAESHLQDRVAQSLIDVDHALEVDPKNARAHWIRAQALMLRGDAATALKSAEAAVKLDRYDPEFQLTLARILDQLADHQAAQELAEQVLANKKTSPVSRARACCQLGDSLAANQSHDYQQALKHHVEAIKLAEPLSTSDEIAMRRSAKEVMLEAHLAVAHDIAWGKWQQKPKVVPKWLERASVIADDLVEHEKESPALRFHVDERALAALAGVRDVPEADQWVEATTTLGKRLLAAAKDDVFKQSLQWRFGLALADALVIEQGQGHFDRALEYGQLATEYLNRTNPTAAKWPNRDYVIGRLYYRMGAIYALKRQNHKEAIVWYQQAVTLLEGPVPQSALADGGRQGETFVSMAVSYWETGARDEAMRLTNQGAKLMEKAVEDGLMDRTALAVPYGNLASMHHELGDNQHAQQYAEMAAKLDQERQRTTQK